MQSSDSRNSGERELKIRASDQALHCRDVDKELDTGITITRQCATGYHPALGAAGVIAKCLVRGKVRPSGKPEPKFSACTVYWGRAGGIARIEPSPETEERVERWFRAASEQAFAAHRFRLEGQYAEEGAANVVLPAEYDRVSNRIELKEPELGDGIDLVGNEDQ